MNKTYTVLTVLAIAMFAVPVLADTSGTSSTGSVSGPWAGTTSGSWAQSGDSYASGSSGTLTYNGASTTGSSAHGYSDTANVATHGVASSPYYSYTDSNVYAAGDGNVNGHTTSYADGTSPTTVGGTVAVNSSPNWVDSNSAGQVYGGYTTSTGSSTAYP